MLYNFRWHNLQRYACTNSGLHQQCNTLSHAINVIFDGKYLRSVIIIKVLILNLIIWQNAVIFTRQACVQRNACTTNKTESESRVK